MEQQAPTVDDLINSQSAPKTNVIQMPGTSSSPSVNASPGFGKIGLALVPFTPVPFTGNGALYAWGRLVAYTTVAVATYQKNKTIATVAGIAAGISLATSLAAKSWE